MGTKLSKPFQFEHPLSDKKVIDLKIQTVSIGFLTIEGTAYCQNNRSVLDIDQRFSVDIDYVKWNGTDIKPVLEAFRVLDDIEEAALRHAAGLFGEDCGDYIEYEEMPTSRLDNPYTPALKFIASLYTENNRG